MAKNDPIKTQLRIPADLHARLQEATADSGRSMNAEIVNRLQDSFALGAQASADRVASIVMVSAMGLGVKVEPTEVSKFVQGMIRSTQDADALREIAGSLNAAIAPPSAHKKPRTKRG